MRLVSWNINGFRSARDKGLLTWLGREKPDVVCLQEVKARFSDLPEKETRPEGYESFWHEAEKKGYSGVTVLSRQKPLDVIHGLGNPEFDREGRVLQVEFKEFVLVNAYFPNSRRDHSRLPYKLAFCDAMLARLQEIRASGKNVVLCGDYNIAHKEIDLKNPKSNKDNAGFLPAERAWMDKFLAAGYRDPFREKHPEGGDRYTWWSYRPGVREKNIGWRLDYFVTNEELAPRVKDASHSPEIRGSDHCPIDLVLRS